MPIEYLTLAITSIGWLVTASFQRRLFKLQSETQAELAEQQERYNRDREYREYVVPEKLAFLGKLQEWFTKGFALWQDAGVGLRQISLDSPHDLARFSRAVEWGDQLMLMLPWALLNDPPREAYPDGARLWSPPCGMPNDALADYMFALRHTVISIVNPDPNRATNPIPPREMIEPLRMRSFIAVERVRSTILAELQSRTPEPTHTGGPAPAKAHHRASPIKRKKPGKHPKNRVDGEGPQRRRPTTR